MEISIAITSCNRATSLARTLEALAVQDFPPGDFEVIVADNGSTDDTRDVCGAYGKKIDNFTYIYDNRPGQLVGWHRSLNIMQGEVACFIDDDVRPAITWLSSLKEVYDNESVGLATGPIRLNYEVNPPDWIAHLTLGEPGALTLPAFGLLDCGEEICEIPGNFVWGTNFTVRKKLVHAAGGFHPCAMPGRLLHFHGDGEIHVGRWVDNAGHRVIYHPGASVDHDIPRTRLSLKSLKSKFVTNGFTRSFQTIREMGSTNDPPDEREIRVMALRYFRDPELAPVKILSLIEEGIREGLATHIHHFQNDPAFKEWVLRDNYLDLDACYVHPDLTPVDEKDNAVKDWREGEE